ncbi:MAG: PorV/PorQ family protein [Elusimicrobiota bacterium]|jgi:hypothetical protein
MRILLALLLASAAAPRLHAEAGRTAAVTLQRPISARAVGLGEAFAAVEGGLDSLNYNPAGLARLARPEAASSYTRGIADDDFGSLHYAHPLRSATVSGGLLYYDAGPINIKLSDGTQHTRTAQKDVVAAGGISLPLEHGLSLGALAKVFRLELAEEVRTTGYAADIGALWRTPLKGLSLGLAAQNLGPDIKFEQEGDPLPLTLRCGAAYSVDLGRLPMFQEGSFGFSKFLLAADAVKVREQEVSAAAGLEMSMSLAEKSFIALRAGYQFSDEPGALALGIGLRQGPWIFDYGLGVVKDVTNSHHFNLGLKF